MVYWKVAVDAPIRQLLTYACDLELYAGDSVIVPLGKRRCPGVVIELDPSPSSDFQIKKIFEKNPEKPTLQKSHIQWAQWVANYYHHPVGDVFSLFFPPLKKKGRGTSKALFSDTTEIELRDVTLNDEQQAAFEAMNTATEFQPHLLWGVTGSGKTEVYIELIKEQLKQQKSSIVLLPEISLTPQLVSRFRQRLGDQVAVIHSHLTERQKTDQWWSAFEGEKKVLIGARSALLCPLPRLGLIIIDEEHEASYKQDEKLKYHARDAAIMRAKLENCPIVLGSATPSLETWYNVKQQRYKLHQLNRRATEQSLPTVSVVDMRDKSMNDSPVDLPFWLSSPLYKSLESNYTKKLQSALFLNRRGVAQSVLCDSCGFIYQCPNCEISLTLHGKDHLVCHYCQYDIKQDSHCPDCQAESLKAIGLGTEQVEEDLRRLFPMAKILRVDRDEIDSRERLEDFIAKMESGEIDILIGTQMIAKGLDFEKLTLVGLIMADIGFNLPDFRASERSYQLITQVSGRAGRHRDGQVYIQTYNPQHPSVVHAIKANTAEFIEEELVSRQELNYPPFSRLACLRISGMELSNVRKQATEIATALREYCEQHHLNKTMILGPAPAPLLKIRNRFRYQILIKSGSPNELHHVTNAFYQWRSNFRRSKVHIDIDPYNMM